ncbi:TRAP transporter small permease [Mailhella massiliensis]|uniref:TRAP transporter small permease n=1 Tax=Mailhella massiliensis TaxID=1903261 RepID=UPI0023F04230|nr:TRAP transporter small permease [Mailhella massiliensis]
MNKLLRILDTVTGYAGNFLLAMLIIIAFLQVVCRYCFNYALSWPEEICRFLFIALAYAGAALTMRSDSHLRVDVALSFSGPRMKKFFNILAQVCSIFYCAACAYLSYDMMLEVKDMEQYASSINMEVWITWIPIPLGFVLMTFYAVLLFVQTIAGKKNTGGTE